MKTLFATITLYITSFSCIGAAPDQVQNEPKILKILETTINLELNNLNRTESFDYIITEINNRLYQINESGKEKYSLATLFNDDKKDSDFACKDAKISIAINELCKKFSMNLVICESKFYFLPNCIPLDKSKLLPVALNIYYLKIPD